MKKRKAKAKPRKRVKAAPVKLTKQQIRNLEKNALDDV